MGNETDRELLELAAHAADIKLLAWNDGTEPYSSGVGFILRSNGMWNPLTDDGDALRLAATLKIDIEWQVTQVGAYPDVEAYISNPDGACFCASEPEAEYRRAIVRAAAEIERQRRES